MAAPGDEFASLDEVLGRHELLPLAWEAAQGAAGILLQRPDDLTAAAKSSPTDAVTEMDTRSERYIVDVLLGARPDDGLLGEEGGERPGTSGVRWVVDPLDGTVNYLYRIPLWGVSIAAEVRGQAEVGVVLTPAFGEGYLAVRGQGAWQVLAGRATRMRAGDLDDLSMALVSTGFGYRRQQRVEQAEVARQLLPQIRDLRRTGSAVIDFCWLARGRVDAFYEDGLNPWDLAAGALIAAEAGIVVQGLAQADAQRGTLVAAKPGIARALTAALAGAGAHC